MVNFLEDVMKKSAVIVQKPSVVVATRVDVTAEQRKLYNSLLFIAQETIKKDNNARQYSVKLSELKTALDKCEKDKNNKFYKEKIKELTTKVAEYNILEKDKKLKTDGIFVLVPHVRFIENQETKEVTVEFELPEFVRERIIKPTEYPYAAINLVAIRGLKSRYAVLLYEIAKDYEKVEIPVMTIENFKKLFGIDQNKAYERIERLRSKVLDKAVSEINSNPNIDFFVNYELIRSGRIYTHIKFTVQPKKKALKEIDNPELQKLISMLPEDLQKSKRVAKVFREYLAQYGYEYIKAQIEYTNQKNPECYIAYIDSATKENYAKVENIDNT